MLRFTLLTACAALAATTASAQTLGPWQLHTYVEGEGGSTYQGATEEFLNLSNFAFEGSGHYRPGYFAGGLLGLNYAPGLSVEGEGVWFNGHLDHATRLKFGFTGQQKTYGGFANARFALPTAVPVGRFGLEPYVAGGIGYGDIRFDNNTLQGDRSGFMYQMKGGLEVKTGTPVSLDLAYRYIGAPKYNQTDYGVYTLDIRTHAQVASVGVKYSF